MTDPILLLLTRLRDLYAMHLAALLGNHTGLTLRQIPEEARKAKDFQEAIAELDTQIARCVEEEEQEPPPYHPVQDDIDLAKRYADQHET